MEKTWIFDIDHTLYPYSEAAENAITSLIDDYLIEELQLTPNDAFHLRETYYKQFGTTLAGLLYYDGIEAKNYLKYKDRFPLDVLDRDENGLNAISIANNRMIAITNSHYNHGERVLRHLGIREKFEKLYGIEQMGFWGKPFRKSFDMVFQDAEIEPTKTVFFEDSVRNLAYPKRLGMITILIGEHSVTKEATPNFVDFHASHLSEAMEYANAL